MDYVERCKASSFLFGCAGSSWLWEGVLQLWRAGAPLPCRALGLFLRGGLLRCGCGAEALEGGLSCDGEAELHPPSPACMWNLCESGIQSCSLRWQADSHPLRQQESPKASFLMAGLLCIHMEHQSIKRDAGMDFSPYGAHEMLVAKMP